MLRVGIIGVSNKLLETLINYVRLLIVPNKQLRCLFEHCGDKLLFSTGCLSSIEGTEALCSISPCLRQTEWCRPKKRSFSVCGNDTEGQTSETSVCRNRPSHSR